MNAGVSSEKEKVKESQSQSRKGDTLTRHPLRVPGRGRHTFLYILYNIYKEKYGNNISLIKSSSTTSSLSFYKSHLEMFKSRTKATTSSPNNTTDIDRYLSVETILSEDNEDFDILE